MSEKIDGQVAKIVLDVMGLDVTTVDHSKKFSSIPEWDSFNNLMLISKFQDEFGIEFTALEIENTQKISDLFELIARKVKV